MEFLNYDKNEIKEQITLENIFQLLEDFGGEPFYMNGDTIVSRTIDHNPKGEGSHKLYYYDNNNVFVSYTAGADGTFDVFELIIKVFDIQQNKKIDFNDAVRFAAFKFGISGSLVMADNGPKLDDWDVFNAYDRIEKIELRDLNVQLKEYDSNILDIFNYNVRIGPWLEDGIKQEQIDKNYIGYYPGGGQITIPHFDINNRLVGVRGRTLNLEDAERYGKYRPIVVNGVQYQHPLGMNLYNINKAKDWIQKTGKAIVFESEKAVLLASGYGLGCAVASCGSNFSSYQFNLLKECGAKEVVIAFDRDWKQYGDDVYKKQTKSFKKMAEKYGNSIDISFIFDKKRITSQHASPIDEGFEKFNVLYKERVRL